VSTFRTGSFDRNRVSGMWRRFVPAHAVNSLLDVDIDALWNRGKRLILLDVDHTIVQWGSEEFPEGVVDWVARAKAKGFDLCILSNTRNPARLERLSTKLGIESIRDKFKPSPVMYRLALIKFKRKEEEAIMIGDQIFTDILGANRCGIEAIWVRKMEGQEFAGTKISRFAERLLRSTIYKALVTPIDETAETPSEAEKPIWERAIFRQFVKFCVVGASSFIVDFGIRWVLMYMIPWNGELMSQTLGRWLNGSMPSLFPFDKDISDAAMPVATVISGTFAIFNSFIWNRRWTFQVRGKEERIAQLKRFYVVAVVGLILNTVVTRFFHAIIPGHPKRSFAIATLIATVIVAVWNFTGQRLYAFKARTP